MTLHGILWPYKSQRKATIEGKKRENKGRELTEDENREELEGKGRKQRGKRVERKMKKQTQKSIRERVGA